MDNPLWDSREPFDKRSAWIQLLMMANHEARTINIGNEMIDIQPGQFFTSIRKLATIFGWNFKRVMRYFDLLKGAGMIRAEGTAKGTLVTVVNYGVYQIGGNSTGNANGNTKGNANGTQTRMNKNVKHKEYIGANAPVFIPPALDEISAYCLERNSTVDPEAFYDYYKRSNWRLTRGGRMTDWKATLRSWERNNEKDAPKISEIEAKMRRAYDANII